MSTQIGRSLGVDLGERRIGISVCDSSGMLATALEVIQRCGNKGRDHQAIFKLAEEEEAMRLVIGNPIALSGRSEIAAESMAEEIAEITAATDLEVVTYDERMTTALAKKAMTNAGVKAKDQKQVIDKFAAAVILQGWLDSQRFEH